MKKVLLAAVALLGMMPGFSSTASADLVAEDRSGWIISGCSNETGEGAGLGTLNALKDGNKSTFWHTVWSATSHQAYNHYFVVDRGEELAETTLNAVGYMPRQEANSGNGFVTECDIYMLNSVEGLNLYNGASAGLCEGGHNIEDFVANLTPTAHGSFTYHYSDPTNRAESIVNFPDENGVAGRYILFVATETNGDQSGGFCNCAEFNAYKEMEVTYSDVTFTFPAFGDESLSFTVNTINGTDANKLIPAVDFFTNAAIEGENTIVSPENNTFNVTGTWAFPFADNQVYRIDIRMKNLPWNSSAACSNFYYSFAENVVNTRNPENEGAFTPERLYYLNTNGFDADGHLKVTLHTVATDAATGFQVAATNNAIGSITETPTEFLVVTNSNANDTNGAGISLRHPDNNVSHVNDVQGRLGIWSDGASQNDGGSFLRFFELTDADFDGLLTGENAALFTQEAIDAAKAAPTAENVRAVFANVIAYNIAITEANALIASVSGYTAEHFGEGLGYLSGSTYEAIAALVASLQQALQSNNLETIVAATDALKAELANVKVNGPEAGKYYRIKGYEGGWYITPTAATGQMAMAEQPTDASAFTFEPIEGSTNTFAVKNYYYNTGITGTHSLGGEETLTFNLSEGGILGAFTLKSNFNGSQYLFNYYDYPNNPHVDRNSAYAERCNWLIEETEKPASTARIDQMKAQLAIYFSASSDPEFYTDILGQLDWCETDEELEETYQNLLENAFMFMQSSLEFGSLWKNNRTGRYVSGVVAEDETVSFKLVNEQSISAFWVAEFIPADNAASNEEESASERKFLLRNVLTNTYVGKQTVSSEAIPAVTSKDDAAVIKLVAGTNGFEFQIIDDAVENLFINSSVDENAPLVVYQVADDAGSFWSVVSLPAFSDDKYTKISFLGEYTEGDYGMVEWHKITGVQIMVPAGATPTAIGGVKVYHLDESYSTQITDAEYSIASLLEGVTPTSETVTAEVYDPTIGQWGDYVEVEYNVDVYNVTFQNPYTDYYYYMCKLSTGSFALTENEATTYSTELYAGANIVKPLMPFDVVVGPAAGTIDELANITFSYSANIYENWNCWEGMTLVANGETTIFEIYPSKMSKYNSYDLDVANSPYYTIPVAEAAAEYAASQEEDENAGGFRSAADFNAAAPGTYTLTLPAEFFVDDENNPSNAAVITWTIEEKDGINEITNVTINGKTVYDLSGRRVVNPRKGIYIINGQKTILR